MSDKLFLSPLNSSDALSSAEWLTCLQEWVICPSGLNRARQVGYVPCAPNFGDAIFMVTNAEIPIPCVHVASSIVVMTFCLAVTFL